MFLSNWLVFKIVLAAVTGLVDYPLAADVLLVYDNANKLYLSGGSLEYVSNVVLYKGETSYELGLGSILNKTTTTAYEIALPSNSVHTTFGINQDATRYVHQYPEASGYLNGKFQVYSGTPSDGYTEYGSPITPFNGNDIIYSSMSADGKYILVTGSTAEYKMYKDNGSEYVYHSIYSYVGSYTTSGYTPAFVPSNNNFVITGTGGGSNSGDFYFKLYVYDPLTETWTGKTTVYSLNAPTSDSQRGLWSKGFTYDGKYLLLGCNGTPSRGEVYEVDWDANTMVNVWYTTEGSDGDGAGGAISPDNRYVVLCRHTGNPYRVYENMSGDWSTVENVTSQFDLTGSGTSTSFGSYGIEFSGYSSENTTPLYIGQAAGLYGDGKFRLENWAKRSPYEIYITQPGTYRADLQICGIDYKTNEVEVTGSVTPTKSWKSNEDQIVYASDGSANNNFGRSCAMWGSYMVVGSFEGESNTQGAIYIYKKESGTWTFKQKISGEGANDYFSGYGAVDIHEDTIIVGAYKHGTNDNTGKAYIYTRSGETWSLESSIVSDDLATDDKFGISVSVHGDYAVVGAQLDDGPTNSGAGYIFYRNGTSWSQQQKLNPGADDENVGTHVSIYGDYVVLSGKRSGSDLRGRAHVYKRSGTTWGNHTVISNPNPASNDLFSERLSLTDGYVAIGSDADDPGGTSDAGQVYVFKHSGTNDWTLEATLEASDKTSGMRFASGISMTPNVLVVGAHQEGTGGANAGAVYIYERSGTSWTEVKKVVASDAASGDRLGYYVGVNNDGLSFVAGAYGESTNGASAGAAYVYEKTPIAGLTFDNYNKLSLTNTPTYTSSKLTYGSNVYDIGTLTSDITIEKQGEYASLTFDTSSNVAYFSNATVGAIGSTQKDYALEQILYGTHNSDSPSQGGFGHYIDTNGDGTRFVLGLGMDPTTGQYDGRVKVYHLESGTWTLKVDIPSPNTASTRFGDSVCMNEDGTRIVVNHYPSDVQTSRAYIYDYASGAWPTTPTATIIGGVTSFGEGDMDMNKAGTVIVFGSRGSGTQIWSRAGDGTWSETKNWGNGFGGYGVAINGAGTRIVTGKESTGEIFEGNYEGGSWGSLTSVIDTSYTSWPAKIRMDSDGTTLIVNADPATEAGIYERQSGTSWTLSQSILSMASYYSRNGLSISYDGNMVLVGDMTNDTDGNNFGRAFLWNKSGGSWSLTKTFSNPKTSPAVNDYWGAGVAIAKNTKDRLIIGMSADSTAGTEYGSVYVHTNAIPDFISFDTYNKLSLSGITNPTSKLHALPTGAESTTTYDIGTATNIYIDSEGTYTAEMKGSDAFALDSTVVSGDITPDLYLSENIISINKFTTTNASELFGHADAKNHTFSKDKSIFVTSSDTADGSTGPGKVFIYKRGSDDTYTLDTTLNAVQGGTRNFGHSLDINDAGTRLVISEPEISWDNGAGRIYVYDRASTSASWPSTPTTTLNTSTDTGSHKGFGYDLALSGDGNTIGTSTYGGGSYNRAYIFEYSSGSWSETKTWGLSGSTDVGASCDLSHDGTRFVVGSFSASGTKWYSFHKTGSTWAASATEHTLVSSSRANIRISGNGNVVFVGTESDASCEIWEYDSSWSRTTTLTQTTNFGNSMASNYAGTIFAIGESSHNSSQGRVFIYSKSGSTITLLKTLVNPDAGGSQWFGTTGGLEIDYYGHILAVNAPGYNSNKGKVELFENPAPPSLTFDTYNKLTFTGADTGSTYKLKYESNTYDLGTISNVYIAYPGTYSAEIKGSTNFALTKNDVDNVYYSDIQSPYFTDASTIVTDSNWSSSTGFEITESSVGASQPGYYAFDNTYTAANSYESTWLSAASSGMPAWLQIQYPQDVVIKSYTIVGRDDTDRYYPTSWQLQGATAAAPSTYVNLETTSGNRTASSWAPLAEVSHNVNTPGTAYRYFRLYVNSSNEGGQVSINELKLFTTPLSGQIGVISTPKLTFDGYNKLTLSGLESGSTSTLKYGSNTYDIGTASNVYISEQGTYEAESKGTTTFALTSNTALNVTEYSSTVLDTVIFSKISGSSWIANSTITDIQLKDANDNLLTIEYFYFPNSNGGNGRDLEYINSSSGTLFSNVTDGSYSSADPTNGEYAYRNTPDSDRIMSFLSTTFNGYADGTEIIHVKAVSGEVAKVRVVWDRERYRQPMRISNKGKTYDITVGSNSYQGLDETYTLGGTYNATSFISFDTYNKLSIQNITPTSSTLKYGSNTYEIGSATNIYVENTGDYSAEIGSAADFALTNTTVSGTLKTVEPVITGGYQFGHALTYDGKLYGWGENSNGELGVGDNTDKTVPTLCTGITQGEVVSIWNQSIRGQSRWAKTRDGRIWVTGDHDSYCLPGSSADFTTFTDVSAQFGDYTQTSNNVVWASGSERATQVLMENGDVWSFGSDTGSLGVLGQGASPTSDRTPRKLNVSNITKITYGGDLILALDSSNNIWMWGRNEVGNSTLGWGPYNVPTNIMSTGTNSLTSLLATDSETVVDIESSYYSMFALTDKGTVYCTGHNAAGQLGQGNTTAKTSSDGWIKIEYFTLNAITVNKLYVGGGNPHVFADTSDGWYCWGENSTGELGLGDTTDKLSPVKFTGVSNIKKFGVGYLVSYAITEDGKYYAWGNGTNNARGDNTTGDITYPKYIDTLPNILAPSFEFDGYDKVFVNQPYTQGQIVKFSKTTQTWPRQILITDVRIKDKNGNILPIEYIYFPFSNGGPGQDLEYIRPSDSLFSTVTDGSYSSVDSGALRNNPQTDWLINAQDSVFNSYPIGAEWMHVKAASGSIAQVQIVWDRQMYIQPTKLDADGMTYDIPQGNQSTLAGQDSTYTLTGSYTSEKSSKYTKDTHTYDTNQAQIVTVSDPGTYDAQIKSGTDFSLKSATVPATKASGLYTWAFHHGNFDNAYGDGDILTARENGRFYADTPIYTGDIGTITAVNPLVSSNVSFRLNEYTQNDSSDTNTTGIMLTEIDVFDDTNTAMTYGTDYRADLYRAAYADNSGDGGTGKLSDETTPYNDDGSRLNDDTLHGSGGYIGWVNGTYNASATGINRKYPYSVDDELIRLVPLTGKIIGKVQFAYKGTGTTPGWKVYRGDNLIETTNYAGTDINTQGNQTTHQIVDTVSSTTYTFTPASTLTANVLMVAGGAGGGGRAEGGGGGAGGLVYTAGTTLSGTKTIVVGNGDSGGIGSGGSEAVGFSGKNTTFTDLDTAFGGGGGGSQTNGPNTGGSGGGGNGGDGSNYNFNTGASGTSNQGFAGGNGANTLEGGGGGGAGGVGANASSGNAGDGGIGKFFGTGSSFTNFGDEYGEGGYFAGGGGGGNRSEIENIPGGRGGGGYGGNSNGYMARGGSLHGMVHTGGGGGGAGTFSRDQHPGYASTGDGGVRAHGGRGGSGIVLIQTNVALPNGANTAVVQVGNPRRRSLPPAVEDTGSEVNRFYIIDSASMPTYKLPTHWYTDPVGRASNSVWTTHGSHSLQKRADGGTSNVFYVTSTEGIFEYGSYMAQSADAIFMPVEAQRYNGLLAIGSNGTNDIHFEMAADGTAALYYGNGATLLSAGTITCFTVGKWHHIALTVDSGGNAVGYVNGYPVVSGTHTSVAAVGSRSGNMHMRVGDHSITFRKFLTYEVSTYNFHMSPKQVLQRAAEVGLGPKLEYDGLNAINVVNTEPGSGTEITIYESNVNDTSNLYVVSCNESSYLLSNAGTYYAQIKGTDTFTITRPLTITDDHFPLYQYPPYDGTTSSLTQSASADTWNTWTISGASNGNGQYQAKTTHAPHSISFTAYRAFNNDVSDDNGQYVDASQKINVGLTLQLPSAKTIRKYRMYPVDHSLSSGAIPGSSTDPTLSGGDPDYMSRPKSWILKGSNDDANWTDLDTVTDKPISIYGDVYSIDSPASYQYYQMFVVNIVDTSALLRIGEWQLWGDA